MSSLRGLWINNKHHDRTEKVSQVLEKVFSLHGPVCTVCMVFTVCSLQSAVKLGWFAFWVTRREPSLHLNKQNVSECNLFKKIQLFPVSR